MIQRKSFPKNREQPKYQFLHSAFPSPVGYAAIIRLVWPLALGMLNNAVLQFVDRAFLAKESMASLAAALPASILAFIVTGFFQSVVAYSGTFVAQYHGAGDAHGSALSYKAGTIIALVSGVLAAAIIPFGLMLLPLVSANAEIISRARVYYIIVSLGSVAICGQMAAASYFTGRGLTRLVFWVNLGGNALNIALDPLLIFTFKLGIAGAAIATVIAMFAQWGVLACLARPPVAAGIGTRAASLCELIKKILRYGIPSGAYSCLNMLSFTIFVFVTGRVGDLDFAVSNACFSVNWLLIAPMEGFAIGAATLVAQSQGRGDSDAALIALRRTLIIALGVVILLSAGAVVFNKQILSLYAPPNVNLEKFFSLGYILIVLMAAWQIFDAADVVIAGALKGAGDTKFVMWWMVAVSFGIWLPLVWVVKHMRNSMPALWGTMVAYVIVICAGEAIRWKRGKWKTIKLL